MITAVLLVWSLNASGVGEVIEAPQPSLAACYAFVGRNPPPAGAHAACVTVADYPAAVATMNENRCDGLNVVGEWIYHYCRGR